MRSILQAFFQKKIVRFILIAALLLSTVVPISAAVEALGTGCTPASADLELRPTAADPTTLDARIGVFSGAAGIDAENALVNEIGAETWGLPLADDRAARLYAKPSVLLIQGVTLQTMIEIPADGEYLFMFDAAVPEAAARAQGSLRLDEVALPGFERFLFPVYFRSTSTIFPRDRYGNEALIDQVRTLRWTTVAARDITGGRLYPLRAALTAGEHTLAFTLNEGALYLGSLYVISFAPYRPYAEYLAQQTASETSNFSVTLEAELPDYKNDTSVRPATSRALTVTPYDTYCQLMNTLGGESWQRGGSTVYYLIDVPQEGLYAITLRALQNTRSNFTVFRRITVNGVVPFSEFNAVPFDFSSDWRTITLGDQMPYRVYLHAGVNVLGIEATNAPYRQALETIQRALLDINALSLEINRLTGNQQDAFREWELSNYIPDIRERLDGIAQDLLADRSALLRIDGSSASPELLVYEMAIENLRFLAADPDRIPVYMNRLSQGSNSAAQLLGSLQTRLQNQPLALDTITVHSPDALPQPPSVPITTALSEDMKRFFASFRPDPYQAVVTGDDEIEVWVNRPRQYVDLLQLMADTSFTVETGIHVKFSIMPQEGKLILANVAGIEPDVALGVSTNIPYELAIRNALYDLRRFPDFDAYIRRFSPGALLGYIINDSVYAIPETQDFWVTYYRRDILESLGLPVPQTWDEVIEVLPELQRYGMNYNSPLSSGSGQRGYLFTAPYLFNFGAQLYSDDGFATGLASERAVEAIRFMADSFTIYGMPLTTVSFYEGFRYGRLPVGVSNAETYMRLTTAAPEIDGLWGMALYPATVLPDGTHNRYATGSAQTSLIFANTDKADQAWEFLKWWMSTKTQIDFQERLVLNYGREYLWFSANVEAFAQLDIPEEHRQVILEQWQWLQEPVRLPGSYMQERELYNIWSRIVFDGVNPRVAIDRSITIINREIARKMEEFGYLRDGEPVREFRVPTLDLVVGWMEAADENVAANVGS